MGQDSLSAALFTKGAHLDRRGLGEFAVRKHLDRACGPLTERTFLCAGSSPRHRRLQSEVLDERIEILVAVKQCQPLLNAARRDQCIDGLSDGDAK